MTGCTAQWANLLRSCGAAALSFSRGIDVPAFLRMLGFMRSGEGEGREPVMGRPYPQSSCLQGSLPGFKEV